MDGLRSAIKKLRSKNVNHESFVPELSFYSVMTESKIQLALADSSIEKYQQHEVVQNIFRHARKVFGVLVLLDCVALLPKFMEAGLLEDAKLPFATTTLTDDVKLSEEEASDFEEKQWELIAPIFCRGTLNRRLGDGTIIPFKQEHKIGKGAFGTVYEVEVDSRHQVLGDLFPEKVARKEFDLEEDHQNELRNLSILNHLKHPNILELLGSYTHRRKHNLLFPLAETGTLASLLDADRGFTNSLSDESLVIALAALASAMDHVHNFSERKIDVEFIGCHHDLRPRNILVFGNSFVLADFGLSTFKQPSQDSATPFKYVGDDYLAPECEDWGHGFQPGTVTRATDIWSLGCILAEVATYLAFGPQGVKDFRQAREHRVGSWTFYQFHRGSKDPSHAVENWLTKLEQSSSAAAARLVLVVRRMLCIEPFDRPKAKEVTMMCRLVALGEVATCVNSLFGQVRSHDNSLDMFLEHTRFDSWRHAVGILRAESSFALRSEFKHDKLLKFDAILNSLGRLRQDLEGRLSRDKSALRLDLSRLLKCNDDLHYFLDSEQMEMSHQYFKITVMEGDDDLLDKLSHTSASGALCHDIRVRANIKHINKLLMVDSGTQSRSMQVKPEDVKIEETFGVHHIGRLRSGQSSCPVWIEWRRYGQHGSDERAMGNMYCRAAAIAELLSQDMPEAFRTLKCSGFFHEPGRAAFGHIFQIPVATTTTAILKPTNLHRVIQTTFEEPSRWPDLDDRFKLALSLAEALLELHTVGWFHKTLTTSNVVFFAESDASREQLLRNPFLVGFNHSRPDDPSAFTSGLDDQELRHYLHPSYIKQGSGYQAEFDYYSLGIILMEIGFWRPYSKIIRPGGGTYEDRRQQLLTKRIPRLKQHMGRDYYEAVRCCIASDFGSHPSGDDQTRSKYIQVQLEERVVARLRKGLS